MTDRPPPHDMREVWQNQKVEVTRMSTQELRSKAARFQRKIGRRNLREYLAAVVVVAAFSFYIWQFDSIAMRAGSVLVIAGTLFVVHQLRRRGSPKKLPADVTWESCLDFHRQELERQRDLLRQVWRWYLLPFVPGTVVFLSGAAIESPQARAWCLGVLASTAVVFLLVGKLNSWVANKLQRQIDELEAVENDT